MVMDLSTVETFASDADSILGKLESIRVKSKAAVENLFAGTSAQFNVSCAYLESSEGGLTVSGGRE
jgi:hypothetical protein